MSSEQHPASREVLIVEDNRINSRVVRHLAEKAGFRADTVATGAEALETLAAHSYEVVLMDLQLPDMSGLEVTRALRDESSGFRNRDTPVVALTAYSSPEEQHAGSRLGIETFLEKPVDGEVLARVLRAYAGSRHGGGTHGTTDGTATDETPTTADAADATADAAAAAAAGAPPPAFDAEELERRLASRALARTVASRFLGILDARLAAIHEALDEGDHASIRTAAHGLASPAANSGVRELHALLKRLEAAAAVGDEAAIREHAAQLGVAAARARRAVEAYLG